jgi:hypothetical protein
MESLITSKKEQQMKTLTNLMLLLSLMISFHANALSSGKDTAVLDPERIEKFSKSVEKFAASQGARVFIVGRVGRPPSELPKGIDFTHTAIAVYSAIKLDNGEIVNGYAIHNLYQEEKHPDRSELVIDYPVDYFWGVHALRAGIIIPSTQLQQRILDVIATDKEKILHNPHYSVIANPFNDKYQNCTEFTLDIINAAIYQTTDYAQLKANTKAHFTPQLVSVSKFKLLLGEAFSPDVTTKDQNGKIYTATLTTIGKYLAENSLLEKSLILEEDGIESPLFKI